jgi:hypothetical protein
MVLIEEAWNAYPHCVTVIVNGYLAKHKFYISIESMHQADRGDADNALGMSNNELSQRKVEVCVDGVVDGVTLAWGMIRLLLVAWCRLDIAEKMAKQTLKEDCDPATVRKAARFYCPGLGFDDICSCSTSPSKLHVVRWRAAG